MTRIRFAIIFALASVLMMGAFLMAGFHTPSRHALVELKYQDAPTGRRTAGS